MEEEQSCSTSCGCGEQNCSCGSDSCGCGDFYDAMETKLMGMAFFAHKSALFDRIKNRVEKEYGEKLDKIADLVVDASRSKLKTEQELEKNKSELRNKLKEVFEE